MCRHAAGGRGDCRGRGAAGRAGRRPGAAAAGAAGANAGAGAQPNPDEGKDENSSEFKGANNADDVEYEVKN